MIKNNYKYSNDNDVTINDMNDIDNNLNGSAEEDLASNGDNHGNTSSSGLGLGLTDMLDMHTANNGTWERTTSSSGSSSSSTSSSVSEGDYVFFRVIAIHYARGIISIDGSIV